MSIAGLLIALMLWAFLWAGAFGLVARRQQRSSDPPILLLLGIGAGALGAVTVLSYPGLSQEYYLTAAAGVFGVLTAAGIAAVVPPRPNFPLFACVLVAALTGAGAALAISVIGPRSVPILAAAKLHGVLPAMILPVLALLGVAVLAYFVLRLAARGRPVLQGAVPVLVIAMVMGFSLPNVAALLASPLNGRPISSFPVPADGIDVARWLGAHSNPNDLVATNLHCISYSPTISSCDPRSFWVSAYSERRILVEGWAYTSKTATTDAPFWNPSLLAANDAAFTDPSAAAEAELRDEYGVRWLFADLTRASPDSIGRYADLRYREGDFAVYELLGP